MRMFQSDMQDCVLSVSRAYPTLAFLSVCESVVYLSISMASLQALLFDWGRRVPFRLRICQHDSLMSWSISTSFCQYGLPSHESLSMARQICSMVCSRAAIDFMAIDPCFERSYPILLKSGRAWDSTPSRKHSDCATNFSPAIWYDLVWTVCSYPLSLSLNWSRTHHSSIQVVAVCQAGIWTGYDVLFLASCEEGVSCRIDFGLYSEGQGFSLPVLAEVA